MHATTCCCVFYCIGMPGPFCQLCSRLGLRRGFQGQVVYRWCPRPGSWRWKSPRCSTCRLQDPSALVHVRCQWCPWTHFQQCLCFSTSGSRQAHMPLWTCCAYFFRMIPGLTSQSWYRRARYLWSECGTRGKGVKPWTRCHRVLQGTRSNQQALWGPVCTH